MAWFYVDDGFSDSKPVMDIPDRHRLAACGLWVLAGSWSAKEELDGFVPDSKLRQIGARPPIIAALTKPGPMSAPLCAEVSGGIQFNSWEKWQPTRAELEAERIENARKREADAERKRAERLAKEGAVAAPSRRRRKGRTAVTSADLEAASESPLAASELCPDGHSADVQCDSRARAGARLDPTRPDPTRPSLSVETSGVCVTSGDAHEATHTDHAPPRFCAAHPSGTRDRCGDCANARTAFDTWQAEQSRRIIAADTAAETARRRRRELIDACPRCDDFGRLDDLSECNHQEAQHA
ncbi:hypothetical protein [Mycolicibacter heraklionensis]|uniref:hypothetical protein n=1 Tax=Mycolicibacter heraklionensis TaxID=512402 RepID=UPI000AF70BB6|nr:hypothetical protein [Mycolicibacter heraklionensis]